MRIFKARSYSLPGQEIGWAVVMHWHWLEDATIAVNASSPGNADSYMRQVNGIDDVGEKRLFAGNQLDESF